MSAVEGQERFTQSSFPLGFSQPFYKFDPVTRTTHDRSYKDHSIHRIGQGGTRQHGGTGQDGMGFDGTGCDVMWYGMVWYSVDKDKVISKGDLAS